MRQYESTQEFLGLRFHTDSLERATREFLRADLQAQFRYVVTPNVHHMVAFLENRHQLQQIYTDAWRIYCDSRVLSRLARLAGKRLSVVPGSDLTAQLLADANARGLKVVVIGPSEQDIIKLARRFPHLKIVGYAPPPGFIESELEVASCIDLVARERASLVFLAVGMPTQEMLACRIASSKVATGMGLCIGASIDFLTGRQRRAPLWMQRAGIEWLHRLICEPRRLAWRYLIECPRIFYLMLRRSLNPNQV